MRFLVTFFLALFTSTHCFADAQLQPEQLKPEPWKAELYSLSGFAEKKSPGGSWEAVSLGTKLFAGDDIHVGDNGRVALQFQSGYFIRLGSQAKLHIDESAPDGMTLSGGALHLFNRTASSNPVITTPIVSAAVRGTEGVMTVSEKKVVIDILEGSADVYNRYGSVDLGPQERAVVNINTAPKKTIIVSGYDSVQWTISFPELSNAQERKTISSEAAVSEDAVKLIASGKISEAREKVRNKDLTIPPVALAKSYILQGDRKLNAAYSVVLDALRAHPDHELLLGRAAEIALYFGEISKAKKFIEHACGTICIDPQLQTVQGFIQLVTEDPEHALVSFNESISKSSEQSTPHLGAALADIRMGKLQEGQTELLRAIHLDPTIAVYRSYLGKLFYEEDLEAKASGELAEAIRLDPLDPTPFLYRGFVKRAQNNPLGAMRDIERSIDNNENRAVYRSTHLLDQDIASRSAALGKIFADAGFQDAARIEALRSIAKDSNNYSAHKLLADSYDPIFYADSAFSEHRIAQLLAPVNSNLLQDANGSTSLNDYTSLFDRETVRSGVGYTFDGRDNVHIPTAQSVGEYKHITWSLGATGALGDGSKHNSYSRDYLISGVSEYQLGWNQKIRGEIQGRYIDSRDLSQPEQDLHMTEGSGALSYVFHDDSDGVFIVDVGAERINNRFRDVAADRSLLITTIFNGDRSSQEDDLLLDQILHENTNLYHSALQYLWDSEPVSFAIGSQLLYQRPTKGEESLIVQDSLGYLTGLNTSLKTDSQTNITGHDGYLYSTVHASDAVDLTLGVVRTDLESDLREIPPYIQETRHRGRFNPKAGVLVDLGKHTVLRAGYFESLRKSSLEDQTSIEPTLVGGLNQRFNDLTGTLSRNAGIGIDWKVPGDTYLGSEYLYRRLTEDLRGVEEEILGNFDTGQASYSLIDTPRDYSHRDQHLVRSYALQRLNDAFAISLEYQHAQDDGAAGEMADTLSNDTIAGTVRWFHSSGVFAFTKASWVRQDRTLHDPYPDGVEATWLVDAGLGYRLPHRRGKVQVEVLNLFNRDFLLDQSGGFNEFLKPEASLLLKFDYSF